MPFQSFSFWCKRCTLCCFRAGLRVIYMVIVGYQMACCYFFSSRRFLHSFPVFIAIFRFFCNSKYNENAASCFLAREKKSIHVFRFDEVHAVSFIFLVFGRTQLVANHLNISASTSWYVKSGRKTPSSCCRAEIVVQAI